MRSFLRNLGKIVLASFVGILAACGGGDSAGVAPQGGGSGSPSAAPQLSADQAIYESLNLSPSASYGHTWLLPNAGTPVSGTNYLLTSSAGLTNSPLTSGPQKVQNSAWASVSNTLALPANTATTRYLLNGQIIAAANPPTDTVSYQGAGVRVDSLAADGVTTVQSQLRTGFTNVPLTGLVNAAPADLAHYFNALFFNPTLLSGTASWAAGAAYVEYTATSIGDTYEVTDYAATTYGTSPSPVATGATIAALMTAGGIVSSADAVTYTLSNGGVSSINGITTYVAASPRPNVTTNAYRTYYELNGNVYAGQLIKDGTVLGGSAYKVTVSGTTTTNYTQNFQIRLNKAASSSLDGAITF